MRIDSLRNLAVIDPDTACRTGTVTDYWLDPSAGRLAALELRPVDIDQTQRVSCARVGRIGHDAVMLMRRGEQAISSLEPIPADWLDGVETLSAEHAHRRLTRFTARSDGSSG